MAIIQTQITGSGGGTAPAHYIQRNVDANGKLVKTGAMSVINLTGVTDVDTYALYYAYAGNTTITQIPDLSSITQITGMYACSHAFSGCTGLTGTVNLSSLQQVVAQNCMEYMFNGCTGITGVNLSNLQTLQASGNNHSEAEYAFNGCTGITGTVDLRKLKAVGSRGCYYMFGGCTGITSMLLNSLWEAGAAGLSYMLYNCTGLTSLNIQSFKECFGTQVFQQFCRGCSSLTTASFDSLKVISYNNVLDSAFVGCTSLQTLYFPALTSSSFGTRVNQFYNMVQGVTGCTIHFPKNLDPTGGSTAISSLTGYPNFGGTNTVLAFDLPSTVLLTGANSVVYERNPKDDTATALAWRVKDIDYTEPNWTSYYTSTLNDPVVSDTIYSDAACTQSTTTITSIS